MVRIQAILHHLLQILLALLKLVGKEHQLVQ
jgi:hypothetical protein